MYARATNKYETNVEGRSEAWGCVGGVVQGHSPCSWSGDSGKVSETENILLITVAQGFNFSTKSEGTNSCARVTVNSNGIPSAYNYRHG